MAQMSQVQELFHEAAQQGELAQRQPWWKSQLFVWEPVLFGTWDGVFTSCMINIFGVVLFLRTGWLVVSGRAGGPAVSWGPLIRQALRSRALRSLG
ncbi:unnamed protein product, partial [Gulo gulo]